MQAGRMGPTKRQKGHFLPQQGGERPFAFQRIEHGKLGINNITNHFYKNHGDEHQ
jgi:hypothetical protein